MTFFYNGYLSHVTVSRFILAIGISSVLCVCLLRKRKLLTAFRGCCYSGYGTVLLLITLLGRSTGEESSMRTLFSTWQCLLWGHPLSIYEILYNVLLFVPLGFFFSDCRYKKRKAVLFTFFVSLGIETVQLLTGLGVFEICDLVHNTLGGYLGALLYVPVMKMLRRILVFLGFRTRTDNGRTEE